MLSNFENILFFLCSLNTETSNVYIECSVVKPNVIQAVLEFLTLLLLFRSPSLQCRAVFCCRIHVVSLLSPLCAAVSQTAGALCTWIKASQYLELLHLFTQHHNQPVRVSYTAPVRAAPATSTVPVMAMLHYIVLHDVEEPFSILCQR